MNYLNLNYMKVTIENYPNFTIRTLSPLSSKVVDGTHCMLGIVTEVGELKIAIANKDFNNTREEHGDTLWYVANICNIYKLNFKELFLSAVNTKGDLAKYFKLHNLADLFKRELAYGKEMDLANLKQELTFLVSYLYQVSILEQFSFEDSLRINIAKLQARYPNQFDPERALNRDLEKEKEILKG